MIFLPPHCFWVWGKNGGKGRSKGRGGEGRTPSCGVSVSACGGKRTLCNISSSSRGCLGDIQMPQRKKEKEWQRKRVRDREGENWGGGRWRVKWQEGGRVGEKSSRKVARGRDMQCSFWGIYLGLKDLLKWEKYLLNIVIKQILH